jgi:hypothetical protein
LRARLALALGNFQQKIFVSLNRLFCYFSLARNERKQTHEPGALDGHGQLSLILGGDACALAAQDAAVRIQEFLQDLRVLVVDELDIMLAKIALFIHGD